LAKSVTFPGMIDHWRRVFLAGNGKFAEQDQHFVTSHHPGPKNYGTAMHFGPLERYSGLWPFSPTKFLVAGFAFTK
jgi:hypothetical protein